MKRLPESELDIMLIIWKRGRAVSVNEILEIINTERELTLSALHSYMRRLVEKGFLKCFKKGKQNYYEALVTEAEYRQDESGSVLRKLYGGSLKNFVAALYDSDQITMQDIEEMKEYLDQFGKDGD